MSNLSEQQETLVEKKEDGESVFDEIMSLVSEITERCQNLSDGFQTLIENDRALNKRAEELSQSFKESRVQINKLNGDLCKARSEVESIGDIYASSNTRMCKLLSEFSQSQEKGFV